MRNTEVSANDSDNEKNVANVELERLLALDATEGSARRRQGVAQPRFGVGPHLARPAQR